MRCRAWITSSAFVVLEGIVCGIFCWQRVGADVCGGEAEDSGGRYWVTSALGKSVGGPAVRTSDPLFS